MLYTFTHIIHHVYSSLSVWVNCWHYIVFIKIVPALTLAWLTVNMVLQVCFLWWFKVAAGATEVAVFGSASETFSKKNINCSVDESMLRFEEVINAAKKRQIPVRGLVFWLLILCYKNEKTFQISLDFWASRRFLLFPIGKQGIWTYCSFYIEENTQFSNDTVIAKFQMFTRTVSMH